MVLLGLMVGIACHAQVTVPLWVVASGGASHTAGNVSISWTLGQSAYTALTAGNVILTQGFQQGDLFLTNIDDNFLNTDLEVTVFPNPSKKDFNILLSSNVGDDSKTQIDIFDIAGRKVYSTMADILSGVPYKVEADINVGLYIIKVTNANRARVIKLMRE